ncbi:asparagine synthase (glutamine-hydrolyzing) [Desulforamulus hydrothermalis]|uniref:asparagine synthase (glutamine-hydrolyzing) n=1 Tax=Desulforamulus hydrothermalis Lam5 = DSM 18033 TaxID=1121428 RepID=K8E926_9FIRM|nr:asparagine synthase (glutamine-hydrolyzing) [Desulforamulus hydrothermalis]CCO08028.1 Asparagine synthetase (glutamine-hydrolyzing) 3 [Desulforamulus hydrothermalis Lam5 = DSM 18033]SHG83789.1 asparagine synthase (glutamine-hydrolysing) [Desulforamulus hydrothermalis Lam5 = DSM 18033]
MCGIAGWAGSPIQLPRDRAILETMTAALAKRGPDAEGYWYAQRVALGHRRLAVVDPAGGAQPMVRTRGDNTFVIVYNGELYNTPELRRQLIYRGYTFSGHSDTEVLLASYMEWGPACVEKFNGIFAFAIWQEAEQCLFLARDRLGVKPLFYARRGDSLIFGSELKALLAHPLVKPELAADGLAEIFALGPARTPGHGVFKNVCELRPGHYLIYQDNQIRIGRYWSLVSQPHPDDLFTTVSKVRWLLEDAITRQLVADVPVCTLLSGGLDSSALSAFAAAAYKKQGSGPLHTYSVDYVDNRRYFKANLFQPDDDAPWIKRMSDYIGSQHHYVLLQTPQLVESLKPAMLARDLPGMADVDASLYLFCRAIKKEATVALSGECADEIFGGYPWFHREADLLANTFPWSQSVERRISLLSPELVQYIKPAAYINARYRETLAEVPKLPGEDKMEARRREMFYLNMVWFMQTLLDRKDRMSMASGLEVRVPFCDHRLVEYVWNIPWSIKNFHGREKGLLRLALADLLPEDVLERRKSPYPKTHHPAYLASVRSLLQDILNQPSSPLLQLINVDAVRSLVQEENDNFSRPWFGQLMTGPQLIAYLYQINTWLATYRVQIC